MALRKFKVSLWSRVVTVEAASVRVAVNRGMKALDADRKARGLRGIDATLRPRAGRLAEPFLDISVREISEGK